MKNTTFKTTLALLALSAFGVPAFAETDTTGQVIELSTSSSTEPIGTGDYTGDGTIKITNTSGGHGLVVNIGDGFTGTLDFAGNFRTGSDSEKTYTKFSSSVKIELSSTNPSYSNTMYRYGDEGTFANDITFKTLYGINASYDFTGSVNIVDGAELELNNGPVKFSGGLTVSDGGTIEVKSGVTMNAGNISVVLDSASASTYSSTALISGEGTLSGTATVTIDGDAAALQSLVSSGGTLNLFSSSLTTTGFTPTVELSEDLKNAGYSISNSEGGVLTIVPEPSAFGLLAGLGALALVVARRRRR